MATGQQTGARMEQAAPGLKPTGLMSATYERLTVLLDRLYNVNGRIEAHVGRVIGPRPSVADDTEKTDPQQGILNEIDDALNALDRALDSSARLLEQLECIA